MSRADRCRPDNETQRASPDTPGRIQEHFASVAVAPGNAVMRSLDQFFEFLGESFLLVIRTCRFILHLDVDLRETLRQMAFIGVASLPIVVVTVAFSGAVLSLYMSQLVVKWGVGGYTGAAVGLSIARELGPVVTAVVVAARAGSAIAAEIGTMQVTEQIDALRALAVSPVQYLVVPRLLASIAMLPILTLIADIMGVIAGYGVAVVNGVAGESFISSLKAQLTTYDVTMGLVKTLFFGAVIATVGSQQGLKTSGGATGVGRSTTSAVVKSIVIVYVLNFFLAYVMFGGKTAFL